VSYLRAEPPIVEVEFNGKVRRVDQLKNLLELLIEFTTEFYRPEID